MNHRKLSALGYPFFWTLHGPFWPQREIDGYAWHFSIEVMDDIEALNGAGIASMLTRGAFWQNLIDAGTVSTAGLSLLLGFLRLIRSFH